jgi:predicted RNA-binding protein with PUA-like domain
MAKPPSQHWLMKSEPQTFSIDDLARVRIEPWTGVRNYQARNLMRDQMRVGDAVLFYHSSCDPPGVAGLARVHRTGVVDETQFDPASPYHDPASRRDEPRWICVDVEIVEKLPALVPLAALRAEPRLAEMPLLRRGMRLSVQPVTAAQYKTIVAMARRAVGRPSSPAASRRTAPR